MATGSSDGMIEKPERMRKKPLERQVGVGKKYASRAEYEADLDKWHAEHDARAVQMQEYNRQQDRLRDRSGRKQKSGAQHRRESAELQKQDARQGRAREWHERQERSRKAMDSLAEKARALGPPPCFVRHDRYAAEKALLGERFVHEWQRVRVVDPARPELHGRCGSVVIRARLCEEDEHGHVVSEPPRLDGRLVLNEKHRHVVLLDDDDGNQWGDCQDESLPYKYPESIPEDHVFKLSPYEVEPWPQIGQQVLMYGNEEFDEYTGTVIQFNGDEFDGYYRCARTFYAPADLVECMMGEELRVGSWVRLLEPHPAAELSPRLLLVPQEGGDAQVAEPDEQQRLARELHEDICKDFLGMRVCVESLFNCERSTEYYKPHKFEEEWIVWDGHAFIVQEMGPDGNCLIQHIWTASTWEFEPVDPLETVGVLV